MKFLKAGPVRVRVCVGRVIAPKFNYQLQVLSTAHIHLQAAGIDVQDASKHQLLVLLLLMLMAFLRSHTHQGGGEQEEEDGRHFILESIRQKTKFYQDF